MHCHIDWHMTGIAQSYRCRHRCSYFLVYLMPLQHGADAMTFNDLFKHGKDQHDDHSNTTSAV